MKTFKIEKGVVAEYKGKYWGVSYENGNNKSYDFVDFDKAEISDPEFCKKPTDKTYNPKHAGGYNPDYDKLLKAKLIHVERITTTELAIKKAST